MDISNALFPYKNGILPEDLANVSQRAVDARQVIAYNENSVIRWLLHKHWNGLMSIVQVTI